MTEELAYLFFFQILHSLHQQLECINRPDITVLEFQEIIMLQKCYIMVNPKWNLISMTCHFNLKILQIRNGISSDLLDDHTETRRDKRLLKHGFLLEQDFPAVGQPNSIIPDETAGMLLCGCGFPGLRNYRPQRFLSFFLGKSLKTKPFPTNMLTKKAGYSQ